MAQLDQQKGCWTRMLCSVLILEAIYRGTQYYYENNFGKILSQTGQSPQRECMDNLLYADAKNCALLTSSTLKMCLGSCSRRKADKFDAMSVSSRRMTLDKGLDCDGSRETLIGALQNSGD